MRWSSAVAALAAIAGLEVDVALDVARSLHGLSLVQDGREDRFRTHLLVRAYVLEQPIDPALWRAMVVYFLLFLEEHQCRYTMIDGAFENLLGAFRAALRYALEGLYVRGALMVSPYLRDRGHYDLAAEQLCQAMVIAQMGMGVIDRLKIYLEQGRLAEEVGDRDQAEVVWRAGLEIARAHGDADWVAAMLIPLGGIAGQADRVAQRDAYWQEALAMIGTLGDRLRASELLRQIGLHTINGGNFRQAVIYWRDALSMARDVGDSGQVCRLLAHLSAALCQLGNWTEAMDCAQEGIELARKDHLDWLTAQMLGDLGIIASHKQDFASSEVYLAEGIMLARASGYRTILGALLVIQSTMARLRGDLTQAECSLIEAQGLANHLRFTCLMCEVCYERGELNLMYQRWEAAQEAFSEAWAMAYDRQWHIYLAPISYGLARLAELRRVYDEAYQWGEESLRRHQALGHYRTGEVAHWLALLRVNYTISS